jgi:Co/Zn/Cd efflux system component
MSSPTETSPSTENRVRASNWFISTTSLLFIVLQSLCTAVMAISGVRVLIGLSALAAAAGLNRPASGYHADAIRIPMMAIAVIGSVVNLYVIWRMRSLRHRPAAQWRAQPVNAKQKRMESFQIALAILSLVLVALEWWTHTIVHNA